MKLMLMGLEERLYLRPLFYTALSCLIIFLSLGFLHRYYEDYWLAGHVTGLFIVVGVILSLLKFNVANCRKALFSRKQLINLNSQAWFWVFSPVLTFLVVIIISLAFGSAVGTESSYPDGASLFVRLYWPLVLSVVAMPIIEELVFRHIIPAFLTINLKLNCWIAIIVSSFLFSIAHNQSEFHMYIFGFIMGLNFHLIRIKTQSLILAILGHGLYNFFIIMLALIFN